MDSQEGTPREVVEHLFSKAVAQGAHSPFPLDCPYWGRQYADKLEEMLGIDLTTLHRHHWVEQADNDD